MWIDLIGLEVWPLLCMAARPSTDGPPSLGHSRISGHPRVAWVRGWPRTAQMDIIRQVWIAVTANMVFNHVFEFVYYIFLISLLFSK